MSWGGKDHPVQILNVDRSGGSSTNPASLQLPLDEVSPLWGKTWREIGIDAFANHRTQGISGVLGSPFLHRPIALVSESGEKIDPAMFAQPLHTLGGDAGENGCPQSSFFCPVLQHAEEDLAKAREHALSLRWQQSASAIAQAAKEITSSVSRRRSRRALGRRRSAFGRSLFRATPRGSRFGLGRRPRDYCGIG